MQILLQKRLVVNKYEKHNLLKSYSYYFLLKSLTNSGIIHNYWEQAPALRKYFKVTRNTFKKIILQLQELELVKVENNDLHISSWTTVAKNLETEHYKNYLVLTYNLTDKQTLFYLMFAADIFSNQKKQTEAVQKKLNFNSSTLNAICNSLSDLSNISVKEIMQLPFNEFQKLLMAWQHKTFAIRTVHFSVLNSIRIDTNRSLKSLRNDWALKDFRTATYIKRKLTKLGIINNEKQNVNFTNCGNRMINICKKYCDIYNSSSKTRGFRFTDQLQLNVQIMD